MTTAMYDDDVAHPDAAQLKLIADLAAQQLRLEAQVAAKEKELALLQMMLRKVQETDLPDAMAAAGCRSFTLTSGQSISIEEGITASLTEAKRVVACQWLRANGFGDLVSENLILRFGRGEEAAATELATELVQRGMLPAMKTDVNTGTLKALIKEQLAAGVELPLDLLGAYQWKKAKIK